MSCPRGITVAKRTESLTQFDALQRLLMRGLPIRSVIDLGAAGGHWSVEMRDVLRDARFHMIDAQPRWKEELDRCVEEHAGFSVTHAAVARTDGECFFLPPKSNPYGGRAYEAQEVDGMVALPAVSIDGEVERQRLPGPHLIKFDIHGLEDRVLEGAAETLKDTNLIIMEMLVYADEGLRFPRLMSLLNRYGFQCVDMAEPMFRPRDSALWQLDMFFVPRSRPEAAYRDFT